MTKPGIILSIPLPLFCLVSYNHYQGCFKVEPKLTNLISESLIFFLKGSNFVLELLDLNLEVLDDLGVLRDVVVNGHHVLLQSDLANKKESLMSGFFSSVIPDWASLEF